MADPIIQFVEVDKAFGKHVVYSGMNLTVFEGETLTIIGGSGEGKSVCLKMIIGLLLADRGRVLFRGRDVGQLDDEGLRDVRRRVAYVFQGGALFDSMSVLDNVGYGLREHSHASDDEIRERARQCLEMVGLGADLLDDVPANLSGGMRKRVALARSIAVGPEVILYDEPTTGLDPGNVERIGDMITTLQRELHLTSIVVTHEMSMAFDVSDRIAMLSDKKFPHVGTPEELEAGAIPEVRDFVMGTIEESA